MDPEDWLCGRFPSTHSPLCGDMCGRNMVEQIMARCAEEEGRSRFAHLFLISYIFLLRLPSEALPIVVGAESAQVDRQAVLTLEGQELSLQLGRRKNKPGGSKLVRKCWCKESPSTCPVHIVGSLVTSSPAGQALFEGITAGSALLVLREVLEECGVVDAISYRTHDLRRGHARDLQISGRRCALNTVVVTPPFVSRGITL